MQFIWNDLIDRARVYLDDDHKEVDGWLDPAKWLTLANVEWRYLYRKWVRMGLVRPRPTDTTFSNSSNTTLHGALAIVGVGEDLGSYVRMLRPAQLRGGADPFLFGSTPPTSKAVEWAAHGTADDFYVELSPPDAGSSYIVRWIPTVAIVKDGTQVVDLPDCGDERLVLGIARRALVKDSSRSAALEQLIRDADAEMTFGAVGRNGGVRVRRAPSYRITLPGRFSTFPTDQRYWQYA